MMAVLAEPPPDRLSLDRGALESEGKEQYLKSLESKLGRLQGADSKKLTSKDVLHSLSEAREDHMQQFMSTETGNDPWASSPTAVRNHFAEFQIEEPGRERRSDWRCLCCCAAGRKGYRRGRGRQQVDLEENMCLMECDELNLSWQTEHKEDVT